MSVLYGQCAQCSQVMTNTNFNGWQHEKPTECQGPPAHKPLADITMSQAIALRALWLTLGENGNLLARSWGRIVTDVDPTALLTLAERLSSKLPKLYEDTIELITATGAVLEAESDRLTDLGALPTDSDLLTELWALPTEESDDAD